MAHVSRQGEHHLVNIGAIHMPEHQATHHEGVAQVMQADGYMAAPIHPAQSVTQRIEDAVGLAVAERQPKPSATTADQKWHVSNGSDMPCACLAVFRQCCNRRRVDWQQS